MIGIEVSKIIIDKQSQCCACKKVIQRNEPHFLIDADLLMHVIRMHLKCGESLSGDISECLRGNVK